VKNKVTAADLLRERGKRRLASERMLEAVGPATDDTSEHRCVPLGLGGRYVIVVVVRPLPPPNWS
jgi:hypothetical protein